MSQIGNRLAGNSGAVQPNSLYSNSPLQQRNKSPSYNFKQTNQDALRQLMDNQPRDNSVSFKNPYSQNNNLSRKISAGSNLNGQNGLHNSATLNSAQFKQLQLQNGNNQAFQNQMGGIGYGPSGQRGPSHSMSSGNIPAYLQNKQGPGPQNGSGGFGGQAPSTLWEQSPGGQAQRSPSHNPSFSRNAISGHNDNCSNDLYSNGSGIYYAPNSNFSETLANVAEKGVTDVLKQLRITKQYLNEKYGHGQKTIDQEVHEKLTRLKTDKVIYQKLLKLSNQYLEDQRKFMKSQSMFGEFLKEVGLKTPEATDSLTSSGNVQCRIAHAQQPVALSLQRFKDAIETLVDKTMMDSVGSSNRLNQTRLEFDAIRTELEDLQRKSVGPPNDVRLIHKFNATKEQYAKNREELLVKLQLLDENRIRVLKNSLETFDLSQSKYLATCSDIVQQAEHQLNQKRIQDSFNGYDQTPGLPGDENYLDEEERSECVSTGGLLAASRTSFGSENANAMNHMNNNMPQAQQQQLQQHQTMPQQQPQAQTPQNMQNMVDNIVLAAQNNNNNNMTQPTNNNKNNNDNNNDAQNQNILEDQTINQKDAPTVSILPLSNGLQAVSLEEDNIAGSQLSPGESAI